MDGRKSELAWFYITTSERVYEIISVTAVSAGVNILTTLATSDGTWALGCGGMFMLLGGIVIFFSASQVSVYRSAARDRLREGGDFLVHLHNIYSARRADIAAKGRWMAAAMSLVLAGLLILIMAAVSQTTSVGNKDCDTSSGITKLH